jgi:hypothetical protein
MAVFLSPNSGIASSGPSLATIPAFWSSATNIDAAARSVLVVSFLLTETNTPADGLNIQSGRSTSTQPADAKRSEILAAKEAGSGISGYVMTSYRVPRYDLSPSINAEACSSVKPRGALNLANSSCAWTAALRAFSNSSARADAIVFSYGRTIQSPPNSIATPAATKKAATSFAIPIHIPRTQRLPTQRRP